ncbi:polyamine transporter 4 [Fusarium napiforme]|uniref:Polyamine transporter 4 n=1 Tax=Fusarium napiforme TaxID=42672 RepID=A0A8H5JVL6_9HYPO|nr:polyamine transporter 4 [Fusarium napiforme]
MPSSISSPQPEMIDVNTPSHPEPSISPTITRINAAYDWTSPTDPSNPRNFSLLTKTLSIASITSLAWSSCFAGAIYAPAQTAVSHDFHQNRFTSVLPLSLYNLGMACGPLVGAPLSETYGRKTVYVATTPIFLAFLLGSGFARDIVSLSICRFFAGMFASPNVNNTSATIMDYCAPHYRGASLGIYYSIPSLGAAVGPLVGGATGESLSYLGITLGTLFACAPFVLIDFSYYQKRLIHWTQTHDPSEPFPPEHRLISSMIGSFLLPASLLIAGWTAEFRIHWILPIFFQGLTMMACLLIYAGVNLFMLDAYGPLYGASASGAMMLNV